MSQKILIAEPDTKIAIELRDYFTEQGYYVEMAAANTDGRMSDGTYPDAVILNTERQPNAADLRWQFARNPDTRYTPFIYITSQEELKGIFRQKVEETDDHCTIPFDIEEMKMRVSNSILRAKRYAQKGI